MSKEEKKKRKELTKLVKKYLSTGKKLYQKNEFQKAISHFKKAIELGYISTDIWDLIGYSEFQLGNLNHAVEYYRKGSEYNPNDPVAWIKYASLLKQNNDLISSIDATKKALGLNSQNKDYWLFLGGTYLKMMKFNEAEESFESVLKIDPNNQNALNSIALSKRSRELSENTHTWKVVLYPFIFDNLIYYEKLLFIIRNIHDYLNSLTTHYSLRQKITRHIKKILKGQEPHIQNLLTNLIDSIPNKTFIDYGTNFDDFVFSSLIKNLEFLYSTYEPMVKTFRYIDGIILNQVNSFDEFKFQVRKYLNNLPADAQSIIISFIDSLPAGIKETEKSAKEDNRIKMEEQKNELFMELEKESLEKLKKMVKVSTKINLDRMQNALKLESEIFDNIIFDWADEFGFTIDGDYLVLNMDTVSDFINSLDKKFEEWENFEKKGIGKQ
ncbi:hypothetical protein LCGC14_0856230 [marine sediment metagenome]|uniref:Uncharacterized protein n=1 Tax=marine sediment metagenome TaxID=412755 RepID=A0A0F9PU27_9ZZZZ|nr:hypothetical protein [archaeon]